MTERSDIHKSSIFNRQFSAGGSGLGFIHQIGFKLIQLFNRVSNLAQEFQTARLFTQMIAYKFFQKFRAFF